MISIENLNQDEIAFLIGKGIMQLAEEVTDKDSKFILGEPPGGEKEEENTEEEIKEPVKGIEIEEDDESIPEEAGLDESDSSWTYEYSEENKVWKFSKDGQLIASISINDPNFDRKGFADSMKIDISEVEEKFGDDETGEFFLNCKNGVKNKYEEKQDKEDEKEEQRQDAVQDEQVQVPQVPMQPAAEPAIPQQNTQMPQPPRNVGLSQEVTGSINMTKEEKVKKIATKLMKLASDNTIPDATVDKISEYYLSQLRSLGVDTDITKIAEMRKEAYIKELAGEIKKLATDGKLTEGQIAKAAEPYLVELVKLGVKVNNPLVKREGTYDDTRKMDFGVNASVATQINEDAKSRDVDRFGNQLIERTTYPSYPNKDESMAQPFSDSDSSAQEKKFEGERVADTQPIVEKKAEEKPVEKKAEEKVAVEEKNKEKIPSMADSFYEEGTELASRFGKLVNSSRFKAIKNKLAELKASCGECGKEKGKPEDKGNMVAKRTVIKKEESVTAAPTTPAPAASPNKEELLRVAHANFVREAHTKLALVTEIADLETAKGIKTEADKSKRIMELFTKKAAELEVMYKAMKDFNPALVMKKQADSVIGLELPTKTASVSDGIGNIFGPVRKRGR